MSRVRANTAGLQVFGEALDFIEGGIPMPSRHSDDPEPGGVIEAGGRGDDAEIFIDGNPSGVRRSGGRDQQVDCGTRPWG